MKLGYFEGGRNSRKILEVKVTFILRRLHETGHWPRTHSTTNEADCCLTSVIGWELVKPHHTGRYTLFGNVILLKTGTESHGDKKSIIDLLLYL